MDKGKNLKNYTNWINSKKRVNILCVSFSENECKLYARAGIELILNGLNSFRDLTYITH